MADTELLGNVNLSSTAQPAPTGAPVALPDAMTKLRSQFPQYGHIPDDVLASRVISMYPQYQGVLGQYVKAPVATTTSAGSPALMGNVSLSSKRQASPPMAPTVPVVSPQEIEQFRQNFFNTLNQNANIPIQTANQLAINPGDPIANAALLKMSPVAQQAIGQKAHELATAPVYDPQRPNIMGGFGQAPIYRDPQSGAMVPIPQPHDIIGTMLHGPEGYRQLEQAQGVVPEVTRIGESLLDPQSLAMLFGAGAVGATGALGARAVTAGFAGLGAKQGYDKAMQGDYGGAAVDATMGLLPFALHEGAGALNRAYNPGELPSMTPNFAADPRMMPLGGLQDPASFSAPGLKMGKSVPKVAPVVAEPTPTLPVEGVNPNANINKNGINQGQPGSRLQTDISNQHNVPATPIDSNLPATTTGEPIRSGQPPVSANTDTLPMQTAEVPTPAPEVVPPTPRPGPDMAGNFNLDRMDTPDDVKEFIRQYVADNADANQAARGSVSLAETAAAAKEMGLTPEQLRAAVPGAGAAEINALRNLHIQKLQAYKAASDAFNTSGSDADLRAMTQAKGEYDVLSQTMAGKTAEAGRTLGSMRLLADAEAAKDPVQTAVAEVMKPVRQGKTRAVLDPTRPEFGSKNTLFPQQEAADAITRIRSALAGGKKILSGIDPTGGKFDNVDVSDLLKVGGYLVEGGLKKFADWSVGMKNAIGEGLTDGQLQHTWANIRAEVASRVSRKQTSEVFTDQLAQRLGSRQAAANFVNDIGHETLNKLLTGEERTPEEEKSIGQAYLDHQKGGPKQGTVSSGTMADVLAARDKVRLDAAIAEGNAPKEPPTRETLQSRRMQREIETLNGLLESKTVRTQNKLATVDTEETMQLRKQLADAQSKYAAMKARIDAGDVDPAVKREADRQQARTDQLTKRLTEISGKVDAGDISVKKSAPPVDTPEQAAIRRQIADKQAQLDAMRKAERDAVKPPKTMPPPPTLEQRFEAEMTRKMGKEAFEGFKKQVSPDAYKALLDGTMTDDHAAEIKQALKDNPRPAPKNAAPELTQPRQVVDALSKELADQKRADKVAARPPRSPEEESDAFWKRRVGGKLDAFKKEVGLEILRKFQSGDTLTAVERRTLGERVLANKPEPVNNVSEASKNLSGIVKETHKALSDQEIDLRRGNTPRDIATKMLLEDGRADAKRIAAKMAGLDDNDIEGLKRVIREESKVNPLQKAVNYWKTGLLTSPRTIAKVLASHTISLGADELSSIPAAITDGLIAQKTGQRSMSGISPAQVLKSMGLAATQGVKESFQILRHGEEGANIQDIGRTSKDAIFERPQTNSAIGQKYMDIVGNSHAAAYRTARLYAFVRSIQAEANFQARWEGLKGPEFDARVKELTDNPTEAMSANAAFAAEKAVYLNDNALTQGTRAFKAKMPAGAKAVVDFLFPFQKVSSNIALKYYQMLPGPEFVGGIMRAVGESKKGGGMSLEAQKAFSETIGKQVTGIGLTALGAYLASKGLMTGYGKQQDGTPEGSIKMLGRWWQVKDLAPVGPLLAVGASLHEGGKGAAEAVIKGSAENPVSRTAETVSRLQESGGGGVVQSLAGSIVPKGISDFAGQIDIQKRSASKEVIKGSLQSVQKGIPGLRNMLPGTGRPETNTLIDPTNSVRVK